MKKTKTELEETTTEIPPQDEATGTNSSKPKLPEGWDPKKARLLNIDFHNGRQYKKGSLVLVSKVDLPEFNSAADIMVIDPGTVELLDRSNVTGAY